MAVELKLFGGLVEIGRVIAGNAMDLYLRVREAAPINRAQQRLGLQLPGIGPGTGGVQAHGMFPAAFTDEGERRQAGIVAVNRGVQDFLAV